MAGLVYILCALTSLSCAILLFKGYKKNGFRLLLWSGIGFAGFFLNNVLLFLDTSVIYWMDLSVIRTLPALIGMVLLVYGLITDTV